MNAISPHGGFVFPPNPPVGYQVTAPSGTVFQWDGQKWLVTGVAGGASPSMLNYVSVKQWGAVIDGVTDDTAAFQAARNSTSPQQTIFVPSGDVKITTWPTGTGTRTWLCDGTTYDGG